MASFGLFAVEVYGKMVGLKYNMKYYRKEVSNERTGRIEGAADQIGRAI